MSKNKKHFTCKSEEQKKAIKRSYAIKSKSTPVQGRTASGQVPKGRTLITKDKYLNKKAKEPEKERPVAVIASNNRRELAVVELSSRSGNDRTRLKDYQQGQSYFKHYVEIEDTDGEPIKVNNKFKENHPNMDVSISDVNKITDKVLNHSRPAPKNRELMQKFRNRDKKSPRS